MTKPKPKYQVVSLRWINGGYDPTGHKVEEEHSNKAKAMRRAEIILDSDPKIVETQVLNNGREICTFESSLPLQEIKEKVEKSS